MTNEDKRTTMAHITFLKMLELFPSESSTIKGRDGIIATAVGVTDKLLRELELTAKKPALYSEVSE